MREATQKQLRKAKEAIHAGIVENDGLFGYTESTVWDISDKINEDNGVKYGSSGMVDYRPAVREALKSYKRKVTSKEEDMVELLRIMDLS